MRSLLTSFDEKCFFASAKMSAIFILFISSLISSGEFNSNKLSKLTNQLYYRSTVLQYDRAIFPLLDKRR